MKPFPILRTIVEWLILWIRVLWLWIGSISVKSRMNISFLIDSSFLHHSTKPSGIGWYLSIFFFNEVPFWIISFRLLESPSEDWPITGPISYSNSFLTMPQRLSHCDFTWSLIIKSNQNANLLYVACINSTSVGNFGFTGLVVIILRYPAFTLLFKALAILWKLSSISSTNTERSSWHVCVLSSSTFPQNPNAPSSIWLYLTLSMIRVSSSAVIQGTAKFI